MSTSNECYVCGGTGVNEDGRHVCPLEARLEIDETKILNELATYDDQTHHTVSKEDLRSELKHVQDLQVERTQYQEQQVQALAEMGWTKPANWDNPTGMGTWEDEVVSWLESLRASGHVK